MMPVTVASLCGFPRLAARLGDMPSSSNRLSLQLAEHLAHLGLFCFVLLGELDDDLRKLVSTVNLRHQSWPPVSEAHLSQCVQLARRRPAKSMCALAQSRALWKVT